MSGFIKYFLIFVFIVFSSFLHAQTKNPFVKNVENAYGYFGFPAWSPDGSSFAAVCDGSVALYNAEDLTVIKKFAPPPSDNKRALISSIQFSRNGKKILVVKNDHSIAVYDVSSCVLNYVISAEQSSAETAVFGVSDFSLLIPFDGKNLFTYFYLIASKSFILSKKFDFNKRILFLSKSADSKKLLISTADSKAFLLVNKDDSWQNLAEYSWNDESFVYPKISSDGSAFLFATAKNKIVVAHISDEEDAPSFTEILLNEDLNGEADFSPDGKYLFLGTKNNKLCVYDTLEGKLLKTLLLGETESLSAAVFSPDGEKLLFTTKKGNLYLWLYLADDSGLELFANKPDFTENSVNYDTDLTAVITGSFPAGKKAEGGAGSGSGEVAGVKLPFTVDYLKRKGLYSELQFELSSVPDPFSFALGADFSVLSYDVLKPFFIGGRFRPFLAFPDEDFPYKYVNSDKSLDSPCLAGSGFNIPFGLCMMPFADKKFAVSAEVSVGANLLYLWNKKLGTEFHRSGLFYSFDLGARLELYFSFLNVFAGVQWDSILKFCVNAGAGVCLSLGSKS